MTGDIQLRLVEEQDLAIFFEHQKDPEANDMAAFTAKEGRDRASFMTHWANILKDPSIQGRTIVSSGNVAGNILSFIAPWSGHREVSYWLGRKFWGKGITTRLDSLCQGIPDSAPACPSSSGQSCFDSGVGEKWIQINRA